jgi:hypothetical protein
MTNDTDDDTLEQLAEYLRLNPDATTPQALGETDADPSVWFDAVEDALASDEPHRALETAETTEPEGGLSDENPGSETDKPASSTPDEPDDRLRLSTNLTDPARGALADALEWFNQQLDADLPDDVDHDTPREYYREGRGWDADTIDEKLLGYAPANYKDELVSWLFDRGHGREAILATGLFGERDDGGLYTTWSGRYVLPYFDAEGRPVFAISRATEPVHSADWKGNKYDKLQVTRDDVDLEEPIYGLDTVEPGEPVLITEGVADAITAHEAGYPCLSPVTVQFKQSDREDLLRALDERDVDRAYLIQDAERPGSSVDEEDRLTLQQFGPGVKGAVKTAGYLSDHGLEARVADLPRPGLAKVDLDDYLQDWNDDLTPLLAGAKPVDQHPAYDDTTARDVALDAAEASDLSRDLDAVDTDGDHSALFDLDIRDVTGLSWDYRGKNPLGHHGESENYFVLLKEYGVAYDHKYKVAYNALTYLLVDAGERRPASPNGRLDDGEVFAAWSHAKREGCIPDDDPIPHRALQHVAREHDLADAEELTDGWKLPADAYNGALEAIREEHGIDPGRGTIYGDGDAEHTAVLPAGVRDLTSATSGWDWRHTAERDDATLTVDDARERTVDAIADAYERGDRVLVEALPTMGKSYGAVKAAADTDEQITVLTGRGRKEQYAQFKQWCDEHGLTYKELPSFTHDCPTAAGEHGEDWRETVMNWYRRGATPQQIHNQAEYVLDRPLPCQVAEDGTHIDCEYRHAWNFDPDNNPDTGEPYDVLIGHYVHAHTEQATAGRTVVFDEFPDAYETNLGTQLQGAVSYWLEATDGVPFDSYTDLVENRDDQRRRGEALLWFEEHGVDTDETHVFDDESAHAAAPLAVFTLLASDDLGNGFERADLDDAGTGLFTDGRDHVDRNPRIHLIRPPALDYASGVVALDGTPTKRMWELALGEQLNHREVLQDGEKIEYVRDALNLNIVRTTEYVKPYNSGDHVNTDQDAALLEAIADQHGEAPAVISTTTALEEYDAEGVLTLDRNEHDALTGGVIDGHARRVKWHGNVLGSNEFDDTRLGAVIGSNHYGDGFIKKWGAYAGEAVERNDEKGQDLSYGGFGDEVHDHMTEHDTLQAAMRFGRDGNGAVVYVHTDTLPDWVPLAGEARVLKTWSDGKRDVLEALEDLREPTTAAVVDHPAVDLSRQQVFDHLEDLRERGLLSREQDPEDGRRVVWLDDGLHRVNEHGDVDFEPVELEDLTEEGVRKLARNSVYTWEFTNFSDEDADSLGEATAEVSTPSRGATTGGDRPPNDAD